MAQKKSALKREKEGLYLCAGGRLEFCRWIYDEHKGKGKYVVSDVSDALPRFLSSSVIVDKDVVLLDLLLLAKKHEAFLTSLFGRRVADFVNEGLSKDFEPYDVNDPERFDRLEVYFCGTVEGVRTEGLFRPFFHALGIKHKKDYLSPDGSFSWPKGSRIPFSISFSPVWKLSGLPLRVAKKAYIETSRRKGRGIRIPTPSLSLFSLIDAVFWELSFYGPPDKRDETAEALRSGEPD